MAGQMIALYEAYLDNWHKRHHSMVQPQLIAYSEVLPLRKQKDCYDVITRCCKYWSGFGDVVHLTDGRVAEFGDKVWTQQAAVFPSYKAWLEFDRPMTFRVYFDMW